MPAVFARPPFRFGPRPERECVTGAAQSGRSHKRGEGVPLASCARQGKLRRVLEAGVVDRSALRALAWLALRGILLLSGGGCSDKEERDAVRGQTWKEQNLKS
jgi:hypothetical protein